MDRPTSGSGNALDRASEERGIAVSRVGDSAEQAQDLDGLRWDLVLAPIGEDQVEILTIGVDEWEIVQPGSAGS